jgi:drug/metabolite transporter (DMT)-like permease
MIACLTGVVAGESLSQLDMVGVATISVGVASLAFQRGLPRGDDRKPVLLAVCTAVLITSYTLVDALGVRRNGDALSYIAWLFFIEALPITLISLHRRRGGVSRYLRGYWRTGFLAGAMATVAYGLVLWALGQGAIAPIVALRETSVLFAAVIGTTFLGEPFGRRRVIAAAVVTAGVAVLNLPG